MDCALKLKVSRYVHLPSIDKMLEYRPSDYVQCRRGLYFLALALYISSYICNGSNIVKLG